MNNFYLIKCASKSKATKITKTNKVLNLNINSESQEELPYVFAQFQQQGKSKKQVGLSSVLIDSGSEVFRQKTDF